MEKCRSFLYTAGQAGCPQIIHAYQLDYYYYYLSVTIIRIIVEVWPVNCSVGSLCMFTEVSIQLAWNRILRTSTQHIGFMHVFMWKAGLSL